MLAARIFARSRCSSRLTSSWVRRSPSPGVTEVHRAAVRCCARARGRSHMTRPAVAMGIGTLLALGVMSPGVASTPLTNPIPRVIHRGTVHVSLELVASGLTAPNWGIAAPGDTARLFVDDQTGTLWAITLADGTKTVF